MTSPLDKLGMFKTRESHPPPEAVRASLEVADIFALPAPLIGPAMPGT